METAGHNASTENVTQVENQAQGAEYGLPSAQIKGGAGGAVKVAVPAQVAERFEAAKEHLHAASQGSGPHAIDEKHKSGMEPLPDRARNMTEVATAKVQSGGEAETRTPEIGFPTGDSVQ